jgi:hypothetical protein
MTVLNLQCSALVLLATPIAVAQHIVYDAGTVGNPPIAPDPTSAGWNLGGWNGQVALTPLSPDPGTGLNAWEVADGSATGRAVYSAAFAAPALFEFTLTMKMVSAPSATIFLEYQDGFTLTDCIFTVAFRVSGSDVLAIDQQGAAGAMVCPNAVGTYHEYQMRSIPGMLGVELLFDGVVLGPLTGGIPAPGTQVGSRWGARSDAGIGTARFHRVEYEALPAPISAPRFCGTPIANSTGEVATMLAFGSPVIGGPGFSLHAYRLPASTFGYFLICADLLFPPAVIPPGSQGRLCLGPGFVGRFNRPGEVQSSGAGGTFSLDVDTLNVPLMPAGSLSPGTYYFQAWHRDANPASTSNFSLPIQIVFQ